MKKIVLFLFSILACNFLFAQNPIETQAQTAYKKGDYKQSAELYQQLADTEGVSADLYYNLGNAYFKQKLFPLAILNYERALLLNPGFEDARFNLSLAQLRIVDKIEPIDTFFLTDWFNSVRDWKSSNAWTVMGIVFFVLMIVGLFLYAFSRKLWMRKLGFYGGIVLLVFCVISNIFAYRQKQKMEIRDYAIVFTPTVTAKSSPAESGTNLFVIHEGAKVKIRSTLGEWSEIELADGNVGWLPSKSIEVI